MTKTRDFFGLLAFLHWYNDWNSFHFPEDLVKRAADQIEELGVSTVRLDIVWSDLHTGPRTYDFSRYDRLFSILKNRKFELLALLHYNKQRLDENGKEIWNHPPESHEEFAHYVETTVGRYKDVIHLWEIWNEPNHPVYWAVKPDRLATYTKLLHLSYAAAKRANPSCTVLNGGITEPVVEDVRHFYENGGKSCSDVLAIHTFLNPLSPDYVKQFDTIATGVRRTMEEFGDQNKKVWITEMGCPGVGKPDAVKNWWAGTNLNEAQQAEWVETQYKITRKYPFIEKVFWAFYRDTNGFFNDGTDYFGLVRFDLTPKPAFNRMQELIRL